MRRTRDAKIIATLGPSSNDKETITRLFDAGIDVFRLNFSHGAHEDHAKTHALIREIEAERSRPIGILLDLQGPKLRVGSFANGKELLIPGEKFTLDQDPTPGDINRAPLLHPEIFAALTVGSQLLINDGKIRLKVLEFTETTALTEIVVGGEISGNKGVNVPDLILPISPLTEKDRRDLTFGLSLGVDWVAMSFVQRPEDMQELRELVGDKADIMAKLEKPSAIEHLNDIVQMAMNRIIIEVERDPYYRKSLDASPPTPGDTAADAISSSLHHVSSVIPLAATVTYTESGFSSFRAARERPEAPVIACTPRNETARRLALVWGVHAVVNREAVTSIDEMVPHAIKTTLEEGFGELGEIIAITAGMPFGRTGTTNMLRLTRLKPLPADA